MTTWATTFSTRSPPTSLTRTSLSKSLNSTTMCPRNPSFTPVRLKTVLKARASLCTNKKQVNGYPPLLNLDQIITQSDLISIPIFSKDYYCTCFWNRNLYITWFYQTKIQIKTGQHLPPEVNIYAIIHCDKWRKTTQHLKKMLVAVIG